MRSKSCSNGILAAPLEPASFEPSLTEKEAARAIGVAPKTMRNWRVKGIGPPFVVTGPKLIRYRPPDLRAYQEANLRRSTSQARTNNASEMLSKGTETTEERSRKIPGVEVDHEQ
jgi:hypothetical protein